jgi:hypothetical protein
MASEEILKFLDFEGFMNFSICVIIFNLTIAKLKFYRSGYFIPFHPTVFLNAVLINLKDFFPSTFVLLKRSLLSPTHPVL